MGARQNFVKIDKNNSDQPWNTMSNCANVKTCQLCPCQTVPLHHGNAKHASAHRVKPRQLKTVSSRARSKPCQANRAKTVPKPCQTVPLNNKTSQNTHRCTVSNRAKPCQFKTVPNRARSKPCQASRSQNRAKTVPNRATA